MLSDPFAWVGATIADKYRVEEVIGEGGFATVYRGRHASLGEPVAIKCLKMPAALDEAGRAKFREAFLEEGRLLYRLSRAHDGIVLALDLGTAESPNGSWTPYLVLEWLEGRTLADVLADRRGHGLPGYAIADALELLDPVAAALAVAHEQRVAHRDIKPANLFLTAAAGRTRLKVLDFGIAKVLKDGIGLTDAMNATGASIKAFTPKYGAPEQFDRKRGATGPWTDVYALALVFVELVSGREVLEGDDVVQLMIASTAAERPTLGARGVAVAPELDRVLAKALAVDLRDRHVTAGEFWRELRAAAALPQPEGVYDSTVKTLPKDVTDMVRQAGSAPQPSAVPQTTNAPLAFDASQMPVIPRAPRTQRRERDSRPLILGIGGAALLAGVVMVAVKLGSGDDDDGRGTRTRVAKSAETSPAPDPKKKAEEERAARDKLSGALAKIPAGTFLMGLADDPAESPVHSVAIAAFELDVTEVTVAAYQECVRAGGCTAAAQSSLWPGAGGTLPVYDKQCNARFSDRQSHPVNCVDWAQAAAFCQWADKRLPSEEEWDYAARGGVAGAHFPWGNAPPAPNLANRCGVECQSMYLREGYNGMLSYPERDPFETTAPVGSFPAGDSKQGLHDMEGNVWEWTASSYCPYPASSCGGELKAARGRSWDDYLPQSAGMGPDRTGVPPQNRLSSLGFRCAR